MRAAFRAFLGISLLLNASLAFAARTGVVESGGADLHSTPNQDASVLEKIPAETPVTLSNQPISGFYKARVPSGKVGWISVNSVRLPVVQKVQNPPAVSTREALPLRTELQPKKDSSQRGHSSFRLHVGGVYASQSDVGVLLGYDGLRLTKNFGADLAFELSPQVYGVISAQYAFTQGVARDTATLKTYDHAVSSVPVMAGLELILSRSGSSVFALDLMGGVGLKTTLNTVSLSDAEPNVTEFSGTAIGAQGKFHWRKLFAGSSFSFFGELGYQYLKTAQLTPSTVGNGGTLFQVNGEYVPTSIDLGGPVLNFGVGWEL